MEPEVSLPLSHVLSSSIQCLLPNPTSWISSLILQSHLRLGVRRNPFPSSFLIKTLYTSLFSQIHIPSTSIHILLDLITRKILNEVTGHWALRHVVFPYPVSSSLLGPNKLLETLFSSTICRLTRKNKNSCRKCMQFLLTCVLSCSIC